MKSNLLDVLLTEDTSNMSEEVRETLIEALTKSLRKPKRQKPAKVKKVEKTCSFYGLELGAVFFGSSVRGTVQRFIKVNNAWARELVPSEEDKEVLVKGDFKVMSPEIMVVIP